MNPIVAQMTHVNQIHNIMTTTLRAQLAMMQMLRPAIAGWEIHGLTIPSGACGHNVRHPWGDALHTHAPSPLPATAYIPRTLAPIDLIASNCRDNALDRRSAYFHAT